MPKITSEIKERAKKIKVILMDVDGVLTRGDIVYDSNGLEIKHFNAHDGQGISNRNALRYELAKQNDQNERGNRQQRSVGVV